MLRGSVQFYVVAHPVQPTHPVFSFQESFPFYMDVLQLYAPMATMTSCAALWPTVQLLQLSGNSCWSSSKSPCAPRSSAATRTSWHPLPCSLQFDAFLFFLSFRLRSWLLSSSGSSCSASSQSHCFRLFGLRGSVEI